MLVVRVLVVVLVVILDALRVRFEHRVRASQLAIRCVHAPAHANSANGPDGLERLENFAYSLGTRSIEELIGIYKGHPCAVLADLTAVGVHFALHVVHTLALVVIMKFQGFARNAVRVDEVGHRRLRSIVHYIKLADAHIVIVMLQPFREVGRLISDRQADSQVLVVMVRLVSAEFIHQRR